MFFLSWNDILKLISLIGYSQNLDVNSKPFYFCLSGMFIIVKYSASMVKWYISQIQCKTRSTSKWLKKPGLRGYGVFETTSIFLVPTRVSLKITLKRTSFSSKLSSFSLLKSAPVSLKEIIFHSLWKKLTFSQQFCM